MEGTPDSLNDLSWVDGLSREDLPRVLARLEEAKARVWIRLTEPRPPAPTRLLTAGEVAERLGVPKARVYDLAREGRIPHRRIGRSIRFPEDAISP